LAWYSSSRLAICAMDSQGQGASLTATEETLVRALVEGVRREWGEGGREWGEGGREAGRKGGWGRGGGRVRGEGLEKRREGGGKEEGGRMMAVGGTCITFKYINSLGSIADISVMRLSAS